MFKNFKLKLLKLRRIDEEYKFGKDLLKLILHSFTLPISSPEALFLLEKFKILISFNKLRKRA